MAVVKDRFLRFKARAPDGKLYTWSQRNRKDKAARLRAKTNIQQTIEYLAANEETRERMIEQAEAQIDDKRKKRGIHADCMFFKYGKPVIPVVKVKDEDVHEDGTDVVKKEEEDVASYTREMSVIIISDDEDS